MPRHAVPRITIGPNTREIKLDIGRTLNTSDKFSKVELFLKRRKCSSSEPTYYMESYAVCGSVAHFQIPDEFLKSDVLKGFYDVEVHIDECPVTSIEIIKAPSRFVMGAKTVDNDCNDSDVWEEPPCEDDNSDSVCGSCGCLTPVENNCPNCCSDNVTVATVKATSYSGALDD